jgi:hypothetical protein
MQYIDDFKKACCIARPPPRPPRGCLCVFVVVVVDAMLWLRVVVVRVCVSLGSPKEMAPPTDWYASTLHALWFDLIYIHRDETGWRSRQKDLAS